MSLPILHIDRPVAGIEYLTDGVVEVVGPEDDRLGDAHACVVGGAIWNDERYDAAPNVRVIARTGIGVDRVDIPAATRHGVLVCNTPAGPTVSTAEHTVTLIFAVAKMIPLLQKLLRDGATGVAAANKAIELDGLTLGLLAYGRIARHVGRICAAVGMRVIAHDPLLNDADVELVSFDDLLSRSDVLSVHCPLLPETTGLFNAAAFAKMKRGALFINCARGAIVDQDALIEALDGGQVGAAGLDVTEPEPLDPSHPLLHRDDVLVTPHVASATIVGRKRMLTMAIDACLTALRNERPAGLLNPDAWRD